MKKITILLIAFAFVLNFTAPAIAEHDPGEKLKGGLETVFTVPYDFVKGTYDETVNSDFYPLGFLGGLLKGAYHGVHDVVGGALDVVTFPFDLSR